MLDIHPRIDDGHRDSLPGKAGSPQRRGIDQVEIVLDPVPVVISGGDHARHLDDGIEVDRSDLRPLCQLLDQGRGGIERQTVDQPQVFGCGQTPLPQQVAQGQLAGFRPRPESPDQGGAGLGSCRSPHPWRDRQGVDGQRLRQTNDDRQLLPRENLPQPAGKLRMDDRPEGGTEPRRRQNGADDQECDDASQQILHGVYPMVGRGLSYRQA